MRETAYLAHYGVKGMKWGVRKDRRPQGWQSTARRGTKRSSSVVERLQRRWKSLSPDQQRQLITSAASVGVGVVAAAVSGGVGEMLVSAAVSNEFVIGSATSAVNAAINLVGNEAISNVSNEQIAKGMTWASNVAKREATAGITGRVVKVAKRGISKRLSSGGKRG